MISSELPNNLWLVTTEVYCSLTLCGMDGPQLCSRHLYSGILAYGEGPIWDFAHITEKGKERADE